MPHFMFQGRYTTNSIKAMVDKPQDREAVAKKTVEAVGGKLISFHFAFGQDDVVMIFEAPDDVAAAAVSMAAGSGGGLAGGALTKLMTIKEAMSAMTTAKKAKAVYSPPA
jgi:uncharacterized protein with GYD domain